MDKIFSARIDESVVRCIGTLAHRLRTSKKEVIEQAIKFYENQVGGKEQTDIFDQTLGAWSRKESPEKTLEKARQSFQKSMMRLQK